MQRSSPPTLRGRNRVAGAIAAGTLLLGAVLGPGRSEPVGAQAPPDLPYRLRLVDQRGGAAGALASGRVVYAGIGPRIVAYDPSRGAIGQSEVLGGIVRDVVVDESRALVYAGLADGDESGAEGGLAILDLSDPALPTLLGRLAGDAGYRAVAVMGDYVLAAGSGPWRTNENVRRGVIDLIDVRQSGAPSIVRRLTLAYTVDDLAILGRRAYAVQRRSSGFDITSESALRSLDVSPPAGAALGTVIGIPGNLSGMALGDDGRIWLAGGSAGLRLATESPEGSLRLVAALRTDGCADALGLDPAGARLAVVDRCAGRLRLYDSGGWPQLIDSAAIPTSATAVAWSGERIVVAGGRTGSLLSFEVAGGRLRSLRSDPALGALRALALAPGGLVGLGYERLTTLRGAVETPESLAFAAQAEVPGAVAMALSGDRAFIATGLRQRIAVAELDDLGALRLLPQSEAELPGMAQGIVAGDGKPPVLFVHSGSGTGGQVTTLSAPPQGAPALLGALPGTSVNAMALFEQRLYVTNLDGLLGVDVSDPALPKVDGSLKEAFWMGSPTALVASEGRVYGTFDPMFSADCPSFEPCSSLFIYDVSTPTAFKQLQNYGLGEAAAALTLSEGRLYVGGDASLRVFDAAALDQQIRPLAESSSSGTVHAMVVRSVDARRGLVYVADGDGGLAVFRLEPSGDPAPAPTATQGSRPSPAPQPSATAPPAPATRPSGLRQRAFLPLLLRAGIVAPAPRPGSLAIADLIGGPLRAAAWQGAHIYHGDGGRVKVYDCSQLEEPVEVGRSVMLPGPVTDLAVRGRHLLATAGDAGLAVFDLGEPASPALLQRIATGDRALGLDVSEEGLVAVAAGAAGLRLFELTADGRLLVRGNLDFAQDAGAVRLHRGHAYVLFPDGSLPIQVIDVRDPAQPLRVAALAGEDAIGDNGFDLALDGDRAYVKTCGNCLRVFDISRPGEPRSLALHLDEVGALAAAGGRLYMVSDILRIFDGSRPDELTQLGQLALRNASDEDPIAFLYGHRLVLDGARIAVVTRREPEDWGGEGPQEGGGLLLIDARDERQPRLAAEIRSAHLGWALLPTAEPDRFYLLQWLRDPMGREKAVCRLLEAADPRRLRLGEPLPALEGVKDLVVEGNTGFALRLDPQGAATLAVFDLADTAAPRHRGSVALGSAGGPLAVADGFAYIGGAAGSEAGLTYELITVDVRDVAAPQLLGRHPRQTGIWSLSLAGDKLWESSYLGVSRWDIKDPARPSLDYHVALPELAVGAVVADPQGAWLASRKGLLRLPAEAREAAAAKVVLPGSFARLVADGKGRLLAAGDGLAIFQIQGGQARLRATFEAPAYRPTAPFQVLDAQLSADHIVAMFRSLDGGLTSLAALLPDEQAP